MNVDLRTARVEELAKAVFDHPASEDPDEPWYFGDVCFEVEPAHQIDLLAELFQGAPGHFQDYRTDQVEQGLWCMMGAVHHQAFCGLVWSPTLPLSGRLNVVSSIFVLYDQVLASYPYEPIDFDHPDAEPRRYRAIDYMVPDLLLEAPWFPEADTADAAQVQAGFLELFTRLLDHHGPVAQYAALHGLGHLKVEGRDAVIDRYLDTHAWLDAAQREYAEAARRGDVL